ncbi:hypothetical protein FOL47_000401, partial [Perkinsus chesapeaki]
MTFDEKILIEELNSVREAKATLLEREDNLVKAIWLIQYPNTTMGKVLCDAELLHSICSFTTLKETFHVGMSSSLMLRNLINSDGAWPLHQIDSEKVTSEPMNIYLKHLTSIRIISPLKSWIMNLLRKKALYG